MVQISCIIVVYYYGSIMVLWEYFTQQKPLIRWNIKPKWTALLPKILPVVFKTFISRLQDTMIVENEEWSNFLDVSYIITYISTSTSYILLHGFFSWEG